MADVTQAASTLLAHVAITNADTAAGFSVVGTEVDVRTFLSATVMVYHAIVEATESNDPGLQYILQGRWETGATVDESWADLWIFTSGSTVAVIANVTGDEAADEVTIAVDDDVTASYSEGDIIYCIDNSVVNAGEWCRVAHISTSIITIVDGLTNAKDASDFFFNQAEIFTGSVDLSGISYVRMIVQGSDPAGVNTHHKAEMIAFTDIE